MKTNILLKGSMVLKPLDKALKEIWPLCTEIMGYVSWSPGAPPKTLAKAKPDRYSFLELSDKGSAKIVAAARNCRSAALVWIMKFDEPKRTCLSCGAALATTKQLIVPGAGESEL